MARGKFHINNEGRVMPCSAQSGRCPFGNDDQHFSSQETAQYAADLRNELSAKHHRSDSAFTNLEYLKWETGNPDNPFLIEDIKRIVLQGEIELDVEQTLELLKRTHPDDLRADLQFFGDDFMITTLFIPDEGYYGGNRATTDFAYYSLNPKAKIKNVIPETLETFFLDPASGMRVPYRSSSYIEAEIARKKEREERAIEEENKHWIDRLEKLEALENRDWEKFEEDIPYEIFRGGECYYLVLPDDVAISNLGQLKTTCPDMSRDLVNSIDFYGYAKTVGGSLKVSLEAIAPFEEHPRDKFDNPLKEKFFTRLEKFHDNLLREKKIVRILGVSPRFAAFAFEEEDLSPEDVVRRIRNSIRREMRKSK